MLFAIRSARRTLLAELAQALAISAHKSGQSDRDTYPVRLDGRLRPGLASGNEL